MAAAAVTSAIGHWTLAIVLALMPSVCRCHTTLHQHTDDAPIAAAHGDVNGSGCGHEHAHHHHDSSHDSGDGDGEASDDATGALAWMISDHRHEVCQCPPIQACIAQNTDDQQRDRESPTFDVALREVDVTAPPVRQAPPRWERPAPAPRTLLRLYCVLLV